ncbi:MAG TPA: hypothetical protein VF008_26900 [Niastella sp.]
MNITSIEVRMYNTGSVGDCLLLLFYKEQTLSCKLMIDCGGWNAPKETIVKCVKDILKTCKGELDLLVVTHQHLDHISGFNQAREEFNQMHIKELWLSWIEDRKDPVGQILLEKYGKKLAELSRRTGAAHEMIAKALTGVNTDSRLCKMLKAKAEKLTYTQDLINLEVDRQGSNLVGAGLTNNDAMAFVEKKAIKVSYLRPGTVLKDLPGLQGIKIYMLGPPRDEDMRYFRMDTEKDEMYAAQSSVDMEHARQMLTKGRIADSGMILNEGESPFENKYLLQAEEKERWIKDLYEHEEVKHRQIETDWLETAASVALRVNRLTNNTSLAMAIECTKSGQVLLFPGDGQSGNWMGWHKPEVSKAFKAEGGRTPQELLKNTVLYKVGHHGSHNGTASKSGLDLMNHRDLVAMLPLVQDQIPEAWGGVTNFPAHALYSALIEKTSGRLIRADIGIETNDRAEKARQTLTDVDLQQFISAVKKGSCYYSFTIQIG